MTELGCSLLPPPTTVPLGARNDVRLPYQFDIDSAGNFDPIGFGGGPSQQREHNRQNQITEIDNEEIHYDGNGNLLRDDALDLTYHYDGWNRLTAIVGVVGTMEVGPEYHYDALGRRIVEERWEALPVHEVRHLFYNDAWQVIHDHQLGPTPVGEAQNYASFQSYYWSAAGGDQMIGRARAANNPLGEFDERLYSLQDAQGNQSVLVDVEIGDIVERAIQSPYGQQFITDKDRISQGTGLYKWLYFHQGLRVARESDFSDNRAQFYDNRARMYSPHLMRFIQNDPIGLGPDPNMYRYVGNGPVSATDPSGLDGRRVVTTGSGQKISVGDKTDAAFVGYATQYAGRSQTKEAAHAVRGLIKDIALAPFELPFAVSDAFVLASNSSNPEQWLFSKTFSGQFQISTMPGITEQQRNVMLEAHGLSSVIGIAGSGTLIVGGSSRVVTAIESRFSPGPAASHISTPHGAAIQANSPGAIDALNAVRNGAPLFRQGFTGVQNTADAQFWSLINPAISTNYMSELGMPPIVAAPGAYPWIMGGQIQQGWPLITRPAPGIGANFGGRMEAVVKPGGVRVDWFHMPD